MAAVLAVTGQLALALPQGNPSAQVTATSRASAPSAATSTTSAWAAAVSTAVPSPSSGLGAALQNYSLPPLQPWCEGRPGSRIYCPGEILQTVQLAALYEDSKTFVDKPTTASEDEVVDAFYANVKPNGTVASLVEWIETYFGGEGLDIVPTELQGFVEEPPFLEEVQEPLFRGWLQIVHSYWNGLVRVNVQNNTCEDCVSSLIPLNHSFVVPGGRFREAYYWDTLMSCEGLLVGGLYQTVRDSILNFMDLIATYGFVPNGGRLYYLNRSQPPVYLHLLERYIEYTNDTDILERAVAIGDLEMQWWDTNRSVEVTGPSGQTHSVHRYNVDTSAARPESYLEDWETVNGEVGGERLNLNTSLYSDISSGAESGMDYSGARWFREPLAFVEDTTAALRTINTNAQIPVDLESILHGSYQILARYYTRLGNQSRSDYWADRAEKSRAAVLDLHWDPEAVVFRDYNMTSSSRADIWSTAAYYPYWNNIIPSEVLSNETTAQKAFSGLAFLTANYNGSIPTTLLETGQQWDLPNVWPPQIYIALFGLQNLPANVSSASFETYGQEALSYSYLPPGHLGLSQDELPGQPVLGAAEGVNIGPVQSFAANGNVGNLTGLGWRDALAVAVASRYESSSFCSWYATGGSIPGILNQLPEADLNATNSVGNTGNMFEKFGSFDIDQAGSGGEYAVQTGFGWNNGLSLWIGREFGDRLTRPACPAIEEETAVAGQATSMHRQMALRPNLLKNLV